MKNVNFFGKKSITLNRVGLGVITIFSILYSANLFSILELVGIFVFMVNGIKSVVYEDKQYKHKFHLCFIIAFVCTFGGGALRDILIFNKIPSVMTNSVWILFALAGVIFALEYISLKDAAKSAFSFNVIDETAVLVFIQGGYALASEKGYNSFISLFSGVLTGCGGGILSAVLFYRWNADRLLKTFKSVGYTLLCAFLLALFGFKPSAWPVTIWFVISLMRENAAAEIVKVVNSEKSVVMFNARCVCNIAESVKLKYAVCMRGAYLMTENLNDFSFKYALQILQLISAKFKRVRIKLKSGINKIKNSIKKRNIYYCGAVKIFA